MRAHAAGRALASGRLPRSVIKVATQTISLEVDPDTARAFAAASEEERRKLRLLLSLRLRELVANGGRPLAEVMDEIGRKAESRGLTPEILDSLLRLP